jgi:thiol-disulfide isomerase/thioredoxin
MSNLLEFYGTECPHCQRMHAIVEQLEKEEGIKIEKLEVWHNEENEKKMKEYDKDLCGGVPFFFNTQTGKFICGEATHDELKSWALGK